MKSASFIGVTSRAMKFIPQIYFYYFLFIQQVHCFAFEQIPINTDLLQTTTLTSETQLLLRKELEDLKHLPSDSSKTSTPPHLHPLDSFNPTLSSEAPPSSNQQFSNLDRYF